MKKKITFSVTESQHNEIKTHAEREGLTPSSFAKRSTIMAARTGFSSDSKMPDTLYESAITSSIAAFNHVEYLAEKSQEHFVCLSLNSKNEIIAKRTVTIGLLNTAQVHPREVFADPITDRAMSIIIAHNHPSGNTTPSEEDKKVTRRIKDAGEILGIKLLDHLIIAKNSCYSFANEGGI